MKLLTALVNGSSVQVLCTPDRRYADHRLAFKNAKGSGEAMIFSVIKKRDVIASEVPPPPASTAAFNARRQKA
jgi:hypothetical protein